MSKKVMVVDDEPDTLELVKAILETEDFDITDFNNAKPALDALKKGLNPDIILLDMRMPEISGPDFCQELAKDEKLKKLKVVFFTASSDLDKTLAKKSGALGFIFKPFSNDDLVSQIKKYLAK